MRRGGAAPERPAAQIRPPRGPRMDAWEPSAGQVGRPAAEFRGRFGKGHTLHVVHNEGHNYMIQTTSSGGLSTTMISAIEPPVTEAIFRHGAAVAAQEHAFLADPVRLRAVAITSANPSLRGRMGIPPDCSGTFTRQLKGSIRHTSAMTMHEHAADYVRFEHAKLSHLKRRMGADILRGMPLLSRAFVESGAARHGVDVDAVAVADGTSLGRTDRRIVGAARRAFDEVRRQRTLGAGVDVVDATADLDDAFGLLRKALCY